MGRLGLTKIVRSEDGCKGCNACQQSCFAHIEFLSTNTIRDMECNHCLDCVVPCPKPNVLALKGGGWKVPYAAYASLLVAGLFVMIGVSQLSGHWHAKPETASRSSGMRWRSTGTQAAVEGMPGANRRRMIQTTRPSPAMAARVGMK